MQQELNPIINNISKMADPVVQQAFDAYKNQIAPSCHSAFSVINSNYLEGSYNNVLIKHYKFKNIFSSFWVMS